MLKLISKIPRNYSGGYGRSFTRHAVNTCNATPAALRIPCSVCSPAHTSMYGRSHFTLRILLGIKSGLTIPGKAFEAP